MPSISMIGVAPGLANIIQDGTIERLMHETLVSETLYRMGVQDEIWQAKQGEILNMVRSGLLPVDIDPLTPGVDPANAEFAKETWQAQLFSYGNTVQHYLPNDYVANVPEFTNKVTRVAINAGEKIDRIVRARLFRAYLGGNGITTALAAIGAPRIHVASGNGFTQLNDVNGLPVAVSATNSVPITFGGAEPANTVTAFTPDDPADTLGMGPCWLTLGAVLTAGVAAREAVLAVNRSRMIIAGGTNSIDGIGAADTLTRATLSSATTLLRASPTVPTIEAGAYHCHLSPYAEDQLLTDLAAQRLIQDVKTPSEYADYRLGKLAGAMLYRNARSPDANNTGTLTSSGAGLSFVSPEIGGEVTNNAGIQIGYTIVLGQGAILEKYVPPMAPQAMLPPGTEIATQNSNVVATSGGVTLNTDRIKMIFRPPIDVMNEMMNISWNMKADWPVPSDITAGTPRFRRAIVIAHAIPLQ